MVSGPRTLPRRSASLANDDPVDLAHGRRVATLATEVAALMGFMLWEQKVLEYAALLHQIPPDQLETDSLRQAVSELASHRGDLKAGRDRSAANLAVDVAGVLKAYHRRCRQLKINEPRFAGHAEILVVCNLFVKELWPRIFERNAVKHLLDQFGWLAREGAYQEAVLKQLLALPKVQKVSLQQVIPRLPQFPSHALRLLHPAGNSETDLTAIGVLASADKALAGSLLGAAARCAANPAAKITSIRQALAVLGAPAARKVLIAAALRPVLHTEGGQELWKHSLEVAEACFQLSQAARFPSPCEAFLAGLLHDVGRSVILRLPPEVSAAYARFVQHGCEPLFAEVILCGFHHGEAGAEALRFWGLPEPWVEAVLNHHAPAQTSERLASLIYLAEHAIGSEEAPPDTNHLEYALNRSGVSKGTLASLALRLGPLEALVTRT